MPASNASCCDRVIEQLVPPGSKVPSAVQDRAARTFKYEVGSTDLSTMNLRSRVESRGSSRGRATVAHERPYHLAAMSIVDDAGLSERLQRAADPATPSWVLADLADDTDSEIRAAVASNPSASELTRLRLQRDPDPAVRAVVTERYGIGA